ncbi:MAG: ABC transporter permease [Acidimicrobiia bacterium]|nr:ABC transporter permease [Acidimicrobiia bacterium]
MSRALALTAAAVLAFLHLPLAVLTVFSFNASRFTVWEGFSFKWYAALAQDTRLIEGAWNSLLIAAAATIFATAAGTLCAYGLWKRRAPLLTGTLYLSLVTPEIVTGVSLLAFYQFLFRYLDIRLGMHTVILAHVTFSVAFVVVVVLARLRTMDATLEEAAMDLGATEWGAFFRVTLPALLPAVAASALLVFTLSFDDYVITSLVAGVDSETLPMVIYAMARRGVNPAVNAISALIVVGLGFFILAAERLREP